MHKTLNPVYQEQKLHGNIWYDIFYKNVSGDYITPKYMFCFECHCLHEVFAHFIIVFCLWGRPQRHITGQILGNPRGCKSINCPLRFSQPLQTVSGHVFCQEINWNRAWYLIYGSNDLPVGNKFWYSIQWIGTWKYEQIWKKIFSHRVQKKI